MTKNQVRALLALAVCTVGWMVACGVPVSDLPDAGNTGGGLGGNGGSGGGLGTGGGGSSSSDGGCTTACDCDPGLGCFNKACISGFAPVYCCVDTTCPNNSICEFPTGNFSRCGAGDAGFTQRDGGFIPRDGGFDYCPLIRCDGGMRCANVGCTACGATGACTK